jgi:hypothetical protein
MVVFAQNAEPEMNALPLLLACATCFGDPASDQTRGANLAILTLLGITGVVLAGFLALIARLAWRARRVALNPPLPPTG